MAVLLAMLVAGCGGGAADEEANVAVSPPPPPVDAPVLRTPSTTIPPGGGIPGISAPPPTAHRDPAPAVNVAADDEVAATAVLRDYFRALGDGRYEDAYRLWGNTGGRSGMDLPAFAASFAKYASYTATIGTPGRVDAGAGQRYVTVPVVVNGRLQNGARFVLAGPVTLHRTANIDGATGEQRSWRLHDSGLKPLPPGSDPKTR